MSDGFPSALLWRELDPASDLAFPLAAQQNLRTAPRKGACPPPGAEAAHPWHPFEDSVDLPMILELASETRAGDLLHLSLTATYGYGHHPLQETWRLHFYGWSAHKEEPFGLPGNPTLPAPPDRRHPTSWEIVSSRWLPSCGMPNRPWQTLRHFVLHCDPLRVYQVAAQGCMAERQEALPEERSYATSARV